MPPTPSPDDASVTPGARHYRPARRLRRPAEFAAVLAASRPQSLRVAHHWLSMTAASFPSSAGAARFGITVGKRNARRAVDRGLVKRVVREASRHAAPALDLLCQARGLRVDVAFRLKAARQARPGHLPTVSVLQWRATLRAEADALLERLRRHLQQDQHA